MRSNGTASVTVKNSYAFKKALVNSAMAVCVASSGTAFVSQYVTKPIKTKASESAPLKRTEQKFNIIRKNAMSYTKPKPYARPFVIGDAVKEASHMENIRIDPSYFSEKIKDLSIPRQVEGEFFEFEDDFEFVEDTPTKYNYSFNEVVKDYNTSRINTNREIHDF